MPPAVGYAIAGIAAGLGGLGAAKVSANANKAATQIESTANDKALAAAKEQQSYERTQQADQLAREADQRAYQRQQFADYGARLQPFIDTGTRATAAAQSFLNQSPHATRAGTVTAPAPMATRSAQPAMITVIAPNGQTTQRPASERDHWLAKGAQVH